MARLRILRIGPMLGVLLLLTTSGFAQDWRIREPAIDGKTVADWAVDLKDDDVAVRRIAVDMLRELQPLSDAALPHLLDVLADPDTDIRDKLVAVVFAENVEHLKRRKLTDRIVKAAERLLQQPDPQARRMGANLLAHVPEPRLVDALLDLLDDPDPMVRLAGAGTLHCCEIATHKRFRRVFAPWESLDYTARAEIPEIPPDPDGPGAIVEPVEKDDTLPRFKDALETVIRTSRLGEAAVVEATQSPKAHVRFDAIVLCQSMKLEAELLRTIMLRALRDSDVRIRRHALENLNRYEKNACVAWSTLSKALDDPDPRIRESAAAALRGCERNDPDTIPELMTRTHHPDLAVRAAALHRLGSFATDTKRVTLPLLPLFDDPDPDIRIEMIRLAGQALSEKAGRAEAVLLSRLQRTILEDNDAVSSAACEAIAGAEGIDKETRTTALLQALARSKHGYMRAVFLLHELEPSGARTMPVIVDRFTGQRDIYGSYMTLMLLRYGEPGEKAFQGVLDRLDPDQIGKLVQWIEFFSKSVPMQRAVAFRALAASKSAERGNALLSLLDSGPLRNRGGFNGLNQERPPFELGEVPPAAMRSLIEAVADPEPEIRANACRVLRLAVPTPLVMRTLLRGIEDKDAAVRQAAIEAIRHHRVYPQAVVERLFVAAREPGEAGECALRALADIDEPGWTALLDERIRHGILTLDWDTASCVRRPNERIATLLVERLEKENRTLHPCVTVRRLLGATKHVDLPAETVLPALMKLACHWDWRTRLAAIERIGDYGPSGKAALSVLGARCADECDAVAEAAFAALEKVGR
jgi:HEAT repeat protein